MIVEIYTALTIFRDVRNSFVNERWIALLRYKINIGYLTYVAYAFGYLGVWRSSFFKNFGAHNLNWLSFFTVCAYVVGFWHHPFGGVRYGLFPAKGAKKPGARI
ncbi:MAG: hypothetical protein HKN87_12355 [Saprospiraceae bacterium]|nr:hypothetical protein [Saprospiraceae bacterium]